MIVRYLGLTDSDRVSLLNAERRRYMCRKVFVPLLITVCMQWMLVSLRQLDAHGSTITHCIWGRNEDSHAE